MKKQTNDAVEHTSKDRRRPSLVEFFQESPLRDFGIVLEREQDFGRDPEIE